MIQRINKTEEIMERLHREGKVTYFTGPEFSKAQNELNKKLEEIRNDARRRRQESSASPPIILC